MAICTVFGGKPLFGTVKISGSKNAALPILFATMLCDGVSVIERVPDISDVSHALSILSSYGARVSRIGETVTVDTSNLTDSEPPDEDVRAFRASSYLIGSCLARFGRVKLRSYGGCAFASRPIDLHIGAALAKGCCRIGDEVVKVKPDGTKINLSKSSVGATVNAILMSATDDCDTVITGAAKEPHVDGLIAFLKSAGANIKREDRTVTVCGTGRLLHGGKTQIIPDAIEAGSYLALGPLTGGEVSVEISGEYEKSELLPFLYVLRGIGVSVCEKGCSISAKGRPKKPISVAAEPYPGFPTDLQPILAVLMASAGGVIRDTVFPDRFGYLSELSEFGLKSKPLDVGKVSILPSEFSHGTGEAVDLRGGMAALSAALAANGKSEILGAQLLLRGYESLFSRLSTLGADVNYQN